VSRCHGATVEREWFQITMLQRSPEEVGVALEGDGWTVAPDVTI
jgi:hypothetical protein